MYFWSMKAFFIDCVSPRCRFCRSVGSDPTSFSSSKRPLAPTTTSISPTNSPAPRFATFITLRGEGRMGGGSRPRA